MKILFDAQMFGWQNYGGATRYYSQLMSCLNNDPEMRIVFPILFSDNSFIRNCSFAKHWRGAQDVQFKGKMRAYRLINALYDRIKIKNSQFDLFHPTYYNPYFLKLLKGRPYVVTVLDMIHELFPDTLARNQAAVRKWKEISILKANALIAISESTKRDLIKFYSLEPSTIHVIPLATALSPNSSLETDIRPVHSRYILYVGSRREGYKNFSSLAKAFRIICEKDKNLMLLCIGGGPFSSSETGLFAKLGISGKVSQMTISDQELSMLFSRACALIYPSYYEGFGIPLLEAFACGCPAAVSNSSSLPEVGAEACLYFDPNNVQEIAEKTIALIADEQLRKRCIEKGYLQVKKFSWDQTALMTKKVYETVIKC